MNPTNKIQKVFDISDNEILTRVMIGSPDKSKALNATALWDTGTYFTSISNRIVEKLSLNPTRNIDSSGVSKHMRYHGLLYFEDLKWWKESLNLVEDIFQEGQKHDIIIGMDIIKLGNFNIKLINDGTQFLFTFSFNVHSTIFSISE